MTDRVLSKVLAAGMGVLRSVYGVNFATKCAAAKFVFLATFGVTRRHSITLEGLCRHKTC